jgi:hypothetical protein
VKTQRVAMDQTQYYNSCISNAMVVSISTKKLASGVSGDISHKERL